MRLVDLKNFLSRPAAVPEMVEVKAASIAEPDADLFALFGVQPTLSNIPVTPTSAMRCAPVAAATALIGSTLATLPAKVFMRLDEGGKEPALEHPAYRMSGSKSKSKLIYLFIFNNLLTTDGLSGRFTLPSFPAVI